MVDELVHRQVAPGVEHPVQATGDDRGKDCQQHGQYCEQDPKEDFYKNRQFSHFLHTFLLDFTFLNLLIIKGLRWGFKKKSLKYVKIQ